MLPSAAASEDALVRIGVAEDGHATVSYELAGPVTELRFAANSHGFVVRYIADVDLMSHPAAAYEAAVRSCDASGTLRLSGTTPEHPVLTLACNTLAERPFEIEIRRIGFLEP